ncbi:hypothetical protein GBAR_LOCUS19058 [Geodia barretti]|uniref:Uncharacterized protein n=1 Tax=Geodia barretti TaxID=519541 RepID=A0AA35SR85_GEOBA|nr:hypothetical protein GBAR_LOCUS19058 [Geodia barretti]
MLCKVRQLSFPPTAFPLVTTEHLKLLHLSTDVFVQHGTPVRRLAEWTWSSLSLYSGGRLL